MCRFSILLFISASVGCVSPCHKAFEFAVAPEGTEAYIPKEARNRVYVTILNGNEPFAGEGLDKLRQTLNENGFAKVSIGGLFFGPYFEAAIRKQFSEDPEARFVIVGYGFGVPMADGIANRLHHDGVPIEAVVAMAPRTLPGLSTTPAPGLRRIDAFAADELATGIVLGTTMEIAQAMPRDNVIYMASLPLIDDPAPLPSATNVVRTPQKKPVAGTLTGQPKSP